MIYEQDEALQDEERAEREREYAKRAYFASFFNDPDFNPDYRKGKARLESENWTQKTELFQF